MEGAMTAVGADSSADEEPVLPEGTALGPYTLGRRLGRGGMGVVYEARHRELGRRVALKTLHPGLAYQASVRTRFLREGRLASRVRHPHVVDVIDLGTYAGTTCLVMEYLEGETLRAHIARRGPLPAGDAVAILLPVTAAVAAAHDAEVVHRDLKPENIFLERGRDGDAVPKVLDFGISKALTSEGAESVTTTSALLGTPSYMAPEQAMDPRSLDPRSDVYALGVVLYELLTGRVPYTGAGGVAVVMAALNGGCASPNALRDDLPAGLSAAVMKALAPRAAERIASTRALGAALLPFAREGDRAAWERELTADVTADPDTREPDAGFATRATEPSDSAPQPAPVRRTPVRWVVGAAALALLGVAVVPRWSVRPADGRSPPAARVSSGPPQTPLLSASTAPTVAPASAADASVAVAAAAASLVAPVAAQRTASARARTPRVAVRARPVPAAPTATPAPPAPPRVTANNAPLID